MYHVNMEIIIRNGKHVKMDLRSLRSTFLSIPTNNANFSPTAHASLFTGNVDKDATKWFLHSFRRI